MADKDPDLQRGLSGLWLPADFFVVTNDSDQPIAFSGMKIH